MGVRGLSTFVDNNQQLLSRHRLHGTRVVIDGNNLIYFLLNHYHVSQQFGGDYDRYARKCKHFFNILRQCHIVPYIVFDGGYTVDDRKLATLLTRAWEKRDVVRVVCIVGRGCVLPILAVETFRQVLVELNIAHVSCQFEADKEIAVLAKRWGCPVISNDSDFFIYNLEGGVMPFDYINTTLCVFDTLTQEESVYNVKQPLGEHQVVYIPVKLYKAQRFLEQYCDNVSNIVLPMLGTLLGNDFIDVRDLSSFYSSLSLPRKKGNKFKVPKEHTRMIAVLHWLESLEDVHKGVEHVLAHTGNVAREKLREKLLKSLDDYMNLEEFSSLDLVEFFEDKACESLDVGQSEQGVDGDCKQAVHTDCSGQTVLRLVDYNGVPLPQWFVDKLATCEIAPFLQNVAVLHRVIFNCQVEVLRQPSSYKCCCRLRQVIYGMLMRCVKPKKETEVDEKRKTHILEHDRERMDTRKKYIMPMGEVPEFGPLPYVGDLAKESKERRRKLLFCALGMSAGGVDSLTDENLSSPLFVATLTYWINNAGPKVSESHLNGLLVCLMHLHWKYLKWIDDKPFVSKGKQPGGVHANVLLALKNCTKAQLDKFKAHMAKYLVKPEHSAKRPRENHIVHGYAQFQSCLQTAIHLNQLLMCPVPPPNPSLIFNGTFVYNICRDLQRRSAPELFIKEMMGHGSPLLDVFVTLRSQVLEICAKDRFLDAPVVEVSVKKSKSKKVKKKAAACVRARNLSSSDDDDSEAESSDIEIDPNNRFAVLSLDS